MLNFPQAATYTDLILKVGLNLQAGQRLLVAGSTLRGVDIRLAPFVKIIVERAYELGAQHVDVIWSDPALERSWLRHASIESIGSYPRWYGNMLLEHFRSGDAFLMLFTEEPDLLAELDSRLIAAAMAAISDPIQEARTYIQTDAINWTVASAPIPPWSARVLPNVPENQRELALWDLILKSCRLNHPDPLGAWRIHLDNLAKRAKWLNERQYASLVYSRPGTQLKVGLPKEHFWQGGASVSRTGIPFVANLPTEEIFTLPHKDQVDGFVTATGPLHYGGKTIEAMSLVFAEGRVVEISAKSGGDALEQLISTDEGAARLGEVAIVPHSSPLSQLGVVFHNMLFDENASSHLALGSAFPVFMRGGEDMTDEEFRSRGGNQSRIHYDFAIGSNALNIDGITSTGKVEPIMRCGEWAT
jgi:aminopeptidase